MLKLNLVPVLDAEPVVPDRDAEYEYSYRRMEYGRMCANLRDYLSCNFTPYQLRYKVDDALRDYYKDLKDEHYRLSRNSADVDSFYKDSDAFIKNEVKRARCAWNYGSNVKEYRFFEKLRQQVYWIKDGCFLPYVTGVLLGRDCVDLGINLLDIESVEDGLLTVFWDDKHLAVQNDKKCVFEFFAGIPWLIVSVDFKISAGRETLVVNTVKKEAMSELRDMSHKEIMQLPAHFRDYNYKSWEFPWSRPIKDPCKQTKTKGETKEVFSRLYRENLRTYSDIVHMAKELIKVHKVDMKSGNADFVSTNKEVKLVCNGTTEDDKKVSLVLYRWTFDDYKHLKFKVGMVIKSDDTRTLEVPLHWVDSNKNRFITLVYINVLNQKEITNFTIQEKLEECN